MQELSETSIPFLGTEETHGQVICLVVWHLFAWAVTWRTGPWRPIYWVSSRVRITKAQPDHGLFNLMARSFGCLLQPPSSARLWPFISSLHSQDRNLRIAGFVSQHVCNFLNIFSMFFHTLSRCLWKPFINYSCTYSIYAVLNMNLVNDLEDSKWDFLNIFPECTMFPKNAWLFQFRKMTFVALDNMALFWTILFCIISLG